MRRDLDPHGHAVPINTGLRAGVSRSTVSLQADVQLAVLYALNRHPLLNRHSVATAVEGADSHDVERAVELLLHARMIELDPGGVGRTHAIPPLRLTELGKERLAGEI